jgi:acetyltransferase-like isoleucine patch superfamily enzyme
VRSRAPAALRGCARVGPGARIVGAPTIMAEGRISIGARLFLSSRPVPSHLVAGPGAELEIGDDVAIACGAAIAAYARVEIGAGTRMGPFVVIMDTNFHGAPGDLSVRHDCRPVTIGEGCRIGARVTITRGAVIGAGAEILAGSVVSSTIPAGTCAGGGRARVLGRAGDPGARWDGVAARLGELVRDLLGLEVAPPLEADPRHLPSWLDGGALRVLDALERGYGVGLDRERLRSVGSLAALAAAVEAARMSR